jgi:uncharacterized protein YqjF (DUF2071 family)
MPAPLDGDVSPDPPRGVAAPMAIQAWRSIAFLHWRVPVDAVAAAIPGWLSVDTFDGSGWVSLVPFRMRVRPPAGPVVPWLADFPETNVRTYVVGPGGRPGLWFHSLDAARLAFVAPARAAGLPYVWSSMRVDRVDDVVRYETDDRLWGGPQAQSLVEVRPGTPIRDDEQSALDRFLTARFRLFAAGPLGRFTVPVEHPRWQLRRAAVETVDDDLVGAAGYDVHDDPIVHYSDGVGVRVGFPSAVRTAPAAG